MKKLIILLPLITFSCAKKEQIIINNANDDSAVVADGIGYEEQIDSIAAGLVTLKPLSTAKPVSDAFRMVEGNEIVKTINGDMLPLTISDEFTRADQKYILKIKNFTGKNITGMIKPASDKMNIRFNQIKFPDGTYDGPYGRDISQEIKEKGEVWLIIGKSNMASGDATGKFTINLK